MKRFIISAILILSALAASASTTTVTATVVDPNGYPYANGTVAAALQYSSAPTIGGVPVNPSSGPSTLSATGAFSISVPDVASISPAGLTWVFTVCGTTINIPPSTQTSQVCFSSPPISVTGASMDITATLNAVAGELGPTLPPVLLGNKSIPALAAGDGTNVFQLNGGNGNASVSGNPNGGIANTNAGGWKACLWNNTECIGVGANQQVYSSPGGWFSFYNSSTLPAGNATTTVPDTNAKVSIGVTNGDLRAKTLGINGDTAMTAAPRMFLSSLGNCGVTFLGCRQSANFTFEKAITIIRLQIETLTAPSGCTTPLQIGVFDQTTSTTLATINAANGQTVDDGGPISVNLVAGDAIYVRNEVVPAGCGTNPSIPQWSVEYKMQ